MLEEKKRTIWVFHGMQTKKKRQWSICHNIVGVYSSESPIQHRVLFINHPKNKIPPTSLVGQENTALHALINNAILPTAKNVLLFCRDYKWNALLSPSPSALLPSCARIWKFLPRIPLLCSSSTISYFSPVEGEQSRGILGGNFQTRVHDGNKAAGP